MLTEVSCRDRIIASEPKLTKREKKIVEYLLNSEEGILNDTITEFAEKAGVSDATVVRFCKHIGYKGYQDFKVHAARDILPREKQYNPVLNEDDDPATICNKIFNSEITVLSRTLLGLDIRKLSEISERLRRARRIVFLGTGGSMNVAKDALHKFMKVGIMVYVYEDMDLQRMAASLLGEEDVVIAVSHSGSNLAVLKSLEIAKERGAYTVGLTGYSKNPVAQTVDVVVQVVSETTMFRSESVSTRIAQLAVLDALVALTALHDYENSYDAIQATRHATSDNKF